MSERIAKTDIKEILKPQNTPEMAFESYTMLYGDKEKRDQTKQDFINNQVINPSLDYPMIDELDLDEKIRNLNHILTIADGLEGDEKAAVWDSAAYRMADLYWLKSLLFLQKQIQCGNEEKIQSASEQHQRLNEELFGTPSEELTQQVFGEAFSQINGVDLTPDNQKLLDELKNGFCTQAGLSSIDIPSIYQNPEQRLPIVSEETLVKLAKYLETNYSDITKIVENYYQEYIVTRDEDHQGFTPIDMFTIFKIVNTVRDPENQHGIGVILDENSNSLSWDTSKMSVVVGKNRAQIKSKENVAAVVVHEYGVHGARAVSGGKSKLPTLGTGLFTEADEGENVDYLTFEEGLATTCEKIINPKKQKWASLDIEKTIAISLAMKGFDFRQSYEVLWRIRSLMLAKNGLDLEQETIEKAKRNAYASLERVYRGTPSNLSRHNSDGSLRVITYNKDLAYLKGKLSVYKYLENADESDIALAFKGKFDPTNKRQLSLAKKYL